MKLFRGKVGLVQRVVPGYRVPFFNALAEACQGGLSIFAGKPKAEEMIHPSEKVDHAHLVQGKNVHLFSGTLLLIYQMGLLNWLSDWDPDVLILEANPRYLRLPAAIRWMHRRGRPVIGWGLGAPPLSGILASVRQARRKHFIHQFDAMITYSQTGAAEYAALGFPEERIFVAVNAVAPAPKHALPIRPQSEKAIVLYVGRLQKRKNLNNLINACAQLPEYLQPDLVIVGDGPDRLRIETLAARIYPRTIFTGALYGQDLEAQFRAADLFVLPGTGGLAIQQAMSYGLAVIAAEADGTQGDLVRTDNGWQIPPSDLPALVKALELALSDLPKLQKMGAESYRIVLEEINLEQMAAAFVEALTRTLP